MYTTNTPSSSLAMELLFPAPPPPPLSAGLEQHEGNIADTGPTERLLVRRLVMVEQMGENSYNMIIYGVNTIKSPRFLRGTASFRWWERDRDREGGGVGVRVGNTPLSTETFILVNKVVKCIFMTPLSCERFHERLCIFTAIQSLNIHLFICFYFPVMFSFMSVFVLLCH